MGFFEIEPRELSNIQGKMTELCAEVIRTFGDIEASAAWMEEKLVSTSQKEHARLVLEEAFKARRQACDAIHSFEAVVEKIRLGLLRAG